MLKFLRFALLIALVLVAVGPVHGQDDGGQVVVPPGETIKVAWVGDLTGPIADLGVDVQQGAEVARVLFNEAGGVQGWEIEYVIGDAACSPDQGTLVANRNASDPEIVAVQGHMCSGSTISASDIYEEARIVMVSPSATNPTVTERGLDVVNRTAFRDDVQGVVDARYLYDVLGVTKLAVLHDNDSYGQGLAEVVQAEFEALGGEVVSFGGIIVEDTDFRPVLTPLVALEPGAIFFGGYLQQAALLVPQRIDVGLEDVIFFSDDGIYGEEFIVDTGDFAEGVYASFAETGEGDPEAMAAYEEKAIELFGEVPGSFHLHSYDASSIIFSAIAKVAVVDDDGNLVIDREELIKAVRETADFPGLTGTLTCDDKGDCSASFISVNLVEGGEWVRLELPEEISELAGE
jgi:branched-chain amino acid transport system substrate-binding protein